MKWGLLISALLMMVSVTAWGETAAELPAQLNSQGIELLEKEAYGQSIMKFNAALEADPFFVPALVNRGIALARREQYPAAVESFQSALQSSPNNMKAMRPLASAYALAGENDKAMDSFGRILVIDQQDSSAHIGYGIILARKNEHNRAIEHFSKALFISSTSVAGFVHRGLSLNMRGDYEAAASDFSQALEIVPRESAILLFRSEANGRSRNFSKAVADLRAACGLGDTHVCTALKNAKAELDDMTVQFSPQQTRKESNEELYTAARKRVGAYLDGSVADARRDFLEDILIPVKDLEWRNLIADGTGSAWYVTDSQPVLSSNGHVLIRSRSVPASGKQPGKHAFTDALYEVDCVKGSARTVWTRSYDGSGRLLSSVETASDWSGISAGSAAAAMMQNSCGPR